MTANNFLLQSLADLLDCPVERPQIIETTALGAAYLAGLQAGIFNSLEHIQQNRKQDRLFVPTRDPRWRHRRYDGWLDAVARTRSKPDDSGRG